MQRAIARTKSISYKLICFICVLSMCMVAFPLSSYAKPSDDKQAQADAARVKLDEMSTQLDEASDAYYTALDEHDAAVAAMEAEQAKIDELQVKIEKSKEQLSDRAESIYRNEQATILDVLLGSSSYEEFSNTWALIDTLNMKTTSLIESNKALKQQSEAAYAEYAAQEQVAQEKLTEAEEAQANAQALVEQYQAEVNSLDAEVAALIEQEKAAEEAAAQAAWVASSSNSSSNSNSGSSSNSYSYTDTDDDYSGSSDTSYSNVVPGNTVGETVVAYAYSRLGCPYVWGATGPSTFDCSGLTSWCYAQAGVSIPRTSGAQKSGGVQIPLSQAQPGDVLWMSGHVGIYIGNGAYIHAPTTGDVVKIAYNMSMWKCAVRYY